MSRLSARSVSVADWLVQSEQVSLDVERDILARREVGRGKYGIELTTWNARDPLVDAYQEVLDLIVYLAQSDMEQERRKPGMLTVAALRIARDIRVRLDMGDADATE